MWRTGHGGRRLSGWKKKGRHSGFLDCFFIGNVDMAKFWKFKKENFAEWGQMYAGREMVKQAKAKGAYIRGESVLISEHFDVYNTGRVFVMQPIHPVAEGNKCWSTEEMTACEIDMRKQTWAVFKLLKENLPGFEKSYIEKTPIIPCAGNGHLILGDYVVTIADMRAGQAHEDGVSIGNMHPDLYEAVGRFAYETIPYDIPYRALASKQVGNILSAGGTVSCGGFAQSALKYCTPTMCMGHAAGVAAGLSAKNNVTPKKLDVKLLQNTLIKQGAKTTVKNVSEEVLAPYKMLQKMNLVFKRQDIAETAVTEEELAQY